LNFRYPAAGSLWPPIQQTLHISPLTPDFLNTTGVSHPVISAANDLIDQEAESPDLFRRNGHYYVSASNTCGYCNGSIGLLYRATAIQGPWTRQIIAADSCEGQVEGVLALPDPSANNKVTYVWHSTSVPGGPRTAFGGHIFQPLVFNDTDGSVADLNCAADARFPITFQKGTQPIPSTILTTGKVDASPPRAAYDYVCDSDRFDLFQTWRATHTGVLKRVHVNVARGAQTVPLQLVVFDNFTSLAQLVSPGFLATELGTATYTPANLTYVFDTAVVEVQGEDGEAGVAVTQGQLLGLGMSGQDISPYCHLEFETAGSSDAAGFHLFQQGSGQNSWRGLKGKKSPVYERVGKSIKFFAEYA